MIIFETNVPLSQYTNYQIGGPAKRFAEVHNESELAEALKIFRANFSNEEERPFILGGGTNLLCSDSGYDGTIIKIAIEGIAETEEGMIVAGAGTNMADIVDFATDRGYSGIEWAGGLPGTFGGAIRGNAGAFRGEMKDSVYSVRSMTLDDSESISRNNEGCAFGYRMSLYKQSAEEAIIGATICLTKGDKKQIEELVATNAKYRKDHQPLEFPSAGSTFKNVDVRNIDSETAERFISVIKTDPFPVIPVAYLLSEAGLKGVTIGGAQISEKHPNFFINKGGAKAEDILALVSLAKKEVMNKFGIEIEPEIQII